MLVDSNNLFQKTKKELVEMNIDSKVKNKSPIQKDWRMQVRIPLYGEFPEKSQGTKHTGSIITFLLRFADTAFLKKQTEALWQPCIHYQVRVGVSF